MRQISKKTSAAKTRSGTKPREPTTPSLPALSGEQIEKELALAHKMVAQAGSTISLMLATRRLSLARLSEAAEKVRDCAAHVTKLVELLRPR